MKNKEINLDDVIATLEKFNILDQSVAFPRTSIDAIERMSIALLVTVFCYTRFGLKKPKYSS